MSDESPDLSLLSDVEIALEIQALLQEAERRYPDADELSALHEAANAAARALLSSEDAAAVGVYPLKTGGAHTDGPPTGGKGDPPPKG